MREIIGSAAAVAKAHMSPPENPLVSVIVPVYNAEKFLPRCLDSITSQSYANLEIILIEDGSPDRSGEICDAYAAKDSRIRVVHQANGGQSAARNRGLDLMSGEYMIFADNDDYLHEDLVKDNLKLLQDTGADLVHFNFTDVYSDRLSPRNFIKEGADYDLLWFYRDGSNYIWDKLYKSALWQNVRFPIRVEHEDEYVKPHIAAAAKKFAANPKTYYFYNHTNPNAGTTTWTLRNRYYFVLVDAQKLKNAAGLFAPLRPWAANRAFRSAFRAYNGDLLIRFMTPQERRNVAAFFEEFKGDAPLLDAENKFMLWCYRYFPLVNYLRGIEYYVKWKILSK